MILGFTGHRPNKLGGYGASAIQEHVRGAVRQHILGIRPECTISGMALGFDQWAAEECIALKVPFVAAVPCEQQDSPWPNESQQQYRTLLFRAHKVLVLNSGRYAPWKMQKRNEWIVDNSDGLLACWDGSNGGTANCVQYAQRFNKPIWRINPQEFS